MLGALPAAGATAPRPSIPAADARTFAVRIVTLMGDGRYDLAWKWLVPLHQQAAPLDRYAACERLSPLPHISGVDVLQVRPAWIAVAGLATPVAGHAVTLRTTFTHWDTSAAVRHTVHVVAAYGRPAWILPPVRYDAYRSGECPGFASTAER